MSWIVSSLLAVATGVGSALLPIINAEVYAVAEAGRSRPELAVTLVVCLALGQTIGKLLLFEAARRGSGPLERWLARRRRTSSESGAGRWSRRITEALGTRRTGLPLVLVSSSLGLPPLAAVSLAAGASEQRRAEFGAVCFVGRAVRFGLLALPAVYLVSRA